MIYTVFIILLFILISVVLFSYRAIRKIDEHRQNEIAYTFDTLIGMEGVIDSNYSENVYLGCLKDEKNTEILVTIYNDKEAVSGTHFKITDIKDNIIIAELVEQKSNGKE